MKILFPCSYNPFFDSTAISNRYSGIISGLLSKNAQIELLVLKGYVVEDEKLKAQALCEQLGIKIIYTNRLTNENIWWRRFNKYFMAAPLLLLNIVFLYYYFNKRYDFIFITGNLTLRRVFNLANKKIKSKGIAEFSEFQSINSDYARNFLSKLVSKLELNTNTELIRNIPNLIIMTKILVDYYKKLSNNPNVNILHLPMTVDFDRFNIPTVNLTEFVKPYIAFVGVMSNAKDGINILIEAFNNISEEFPEFKLYLVGPWQPDTYVHQQRISELNLQDKIIWTKEYPKEKIPSILKNANLLVLPRPNSKQAQGGFPTKLGEYLASGNPVCATKVGEIPDYLVDNESVFFAEPDSIKSFEEAMRRAIQNPTCAKKIGQNGKMIAELTFNKDIQAEKLFEYLKQIKENRN